MSVGFYLNVICEKCGVEYFSVYCDPDLGLENFTCPNCGFVIELTCRKVEVETDYRGGK